MYYTYICILYIKRAAPNLEPIFASLGGISLLLNMLFKKMIATQVAWISCYGGQERFVWTKEYELG